MTFQFYKTRADAGTPTGEPHTLTVYREDGELHYDLEHPQSCQQEDRDGYAEYTCYIAWQEGNADLFETLDYSGTPVTEPGTYQIQGWTREITSYYGGREYDAGISLIQDGGDHGSQEEQ